MPYFYIVATPIGNLEDISFRALRILKEVDFILCEDTRVTAKLLTHYKIAAKTMSYHQHSKLSRVEQIKELIKSGKNLAIVSDAGTPGVSDPGGMLVHELVSEFGSKIKIVAVPGPSAAMAALSMSGFPADEFVFLGFPPHKKGRAKFWQLLAKESRTVVFYESPHRILKTLTELASAIGNREVMAAREITKKFETNYRGTSEQVLELVQKDPVKGEYVVVVSRKK